MADEDLETDDLRQLARPRPSGPSSPGGAGATSGGGGEHEDLTDETQDFRFLSHFASTTTSSSKSRDPTIPKRGEKDFSPDGTGLQSQILAESRSAMHSALAYPRTHTSRVHVRAIWRRERRMAEVRSPKGTMWKSVGRVDRTGSMWLWPEEVVYAVERGGVECWLEQEGEKEAEGKEQERGDKEEDGGEQEKGVALSLQAMYAECLSKGVGVEKYQVYAHLKRAGYIVLRAETFSDDNDDEEGGKSAPAPPSQPRSTYHPPSPPPLGLFSHLYHTLFSPFTRSAPNGPLINPTTFRSYPQIYPRLSLIACHHPSLSLAHPTPEEKKEKKNRFRVAFNIYKPQPHFRKSDPGEPDFRVVVVAASEAAEVMKLGEVEGLFDSTPAPPVPPTAAPAPVAQGARGEKAGREGGRGRGKPRGAAGGGGAGNIFQKLKDGRKSVVLAVVDGGVISFIRLGDVGFGEVRLYEKVDEGKRGGKKRGGGGVAGENGKGGGGGVISVL